LSTKGVVCCVVDEWCTLSYEIVHVLSTLSLHSTKNFLLSLHFVYLNPRCHDISETREEIEKNLSNFSEILHCRVFRFVMKFMKSLMLQICIRVIYVCNTHFLLYISLWEKQIRDCSLQTLHTMWCTQCAFIVIFSVLWVFILLKCPGYS